MTQRLSPPPVLSQAQQDRFWSRLKVLPSGCHRWTGCLGSDGYGRVSLGGRSQRTHRIAHFLASGGDWPEVVRHRCNTPACCNPAHLCGGTQADNMRDRQQQGRQPMGSRNGRAKLHERLIPTIRARATREPMSRLAAEYGVTRRVISNVVRDRSWRHVERE